jgi:hypothetical protein
MPQIWLCAKRRFRGLQTIVWIVKIETSFQSVGDLVQETEYDVNRIFVWDDVPMDKAEGIDGRMEALIA